MLKGQFYQDLMEDVGGGYCGAFEDGEKNTYRPNNEIAKTDKEQQYNEIMMVHNFTEKGNSSLISFQHEIKRKDFICSTIQR